MKWTNKNIQITLERNYYKLKHWTNYANRENEKYSGKYISFYVLSTFMLFFYFWEMDVVHVQYH